MIDRGPLATRPWNLALPLTDQVVESDNRRRYDFTLFFIGLRRKLFMPRMCEWDHPGFDYKSSCKKQKRPAV